MRLGRKLYQVRRTSTTDDQAEIELFVYKGIQTTDRPVTPTATGVTSMVATLDSGANVYAFFDIGAYIMDEMQIEMTTSSLVTRIGAEEGVWADWRTRLINSGTPGSWTSFTQVAFTPGYGLFESSDTDPSFPDNYGVMIAKDTTIYIPSGERLIVPVCDWYSTGAGEVQTFYNGSTHTTAVAAPGTETDTDSIVQYLQEPVALDTVSLHQFNGVSTYELTHNIVRVPDPNNQAVKIFFVNRFGAIQEMWFFGRQNESFRTQGISARRDTTRYASFTNRDHQYIDFYKNARETLTLNSGWQVEANNEFFKDLLMSEQVWLSTDTAALPIRVTSNNVQMKSQRWDRVINYTIEFERAYDYAIQ